MHERVLMLTSSWSMSHLFLQSPPLVQPLSEFLQKGDANSESGSDSDFDVGPRRGQRGRSTSKVRIPVSTSHPFLLSFSYSLHLMTTILFVLASFEWKCIFQCYGMCFFSLPGWCIVCCSCCFSQSHREILIQIREINFAERAGIGSKSGVG